MACTYTGSIEGDRAHAAQIRAESLIEEVDKVTRLLCFLTHRFEKVNPSVFGGLLKENKELADWIKKHEAKDSERWFLHYKTQYPNFNKEEILKMVKNGILEAV